MFSGFKNSLFPWHPLPPHLISHLRTLDDIIEVFSRKTVSCIEIAREILSRERVRERSCCVVGIDLLVRGSVVPALVCNCFDNLYHIAEQQQ